MAGRATWNILAILFNNCDGQEMSRLTVIVPVWKGRHPEYANRLKRHAKDMPYLIRFVWNEGGQDYFDKVAQAVAAVDTPYCMRADDDDFLSMSGIERSLDFLEANPDFVASSGLIAGFSVRGRAAPLRGRLNRRYLYYLAKELNQATAHDRLIAGANKLWVYYAVHTTRALKTITQDIADIGFSDLLLFEAFHTMRTLTLGKVHLDDQSISYFRQYGTSSSAAGNRDWLSLFLRSRFTSDVHNMCRIIPSDMALAALQEKFQQFLRANFSKTQQIKRAIERRFPRLARAWRGRPRLFERKLPSAEWAAIQKVLDFKPIAAICVSTQTPEGKILSDRFDGPLDCDAADFYLTHGHRGERWECVLTEVARQFPYPEIPDTNFIPEGLIQLQMAKYYSRRHVDEPLRVYYPSPDGLTAKKWL